MTISIVKGDSETRLNYKTGPTPEVEIIASMLGSDPPVEVEGLSARFSCLDEFYAVLLTRVLRALPDLLYLLTVENYRDRLRRLAWAHLPNDWYVERDMELVTNGYRGTENIFKTVPMYTTDEVLARTRVCDASTLECLQKFRYGARDFFPADQFGVHGELLPVYSELLTILRQKPAVDDWELALWWINQTGWLSGFAPRDLLLDTPDDVRRAAEQYVLRDEH